MCSGILRLGFVVYRRRYVVVEVEGFSIRGKTFFFVFIVRGAVGGYLRCVFVSGVYFCAVFNVLCVELFCFLI